MAASRAEGSQRRAQPGTARLAAAGCEVLTLRRVGPIGSACQRRAMYSPGGRPTRSEPPVRPGEVVGLATSARRATTANRRTLRHTVETYRGSEPEGAPMQAFDEAVTARGRRSARRAGR